MKFAVFGRPGEKSLLALYQLIDYCKEQGDELLIHKFFPEKDTKLKAYTIFDKNYDLTGVDLAISIGGDGTFIRLTRMVAPVGVPILGVNTGRLGFLADISSNAIAEVLNDFKNDLCSIENRSMLQLHTDCGCHLDSNIAINEISILRQDTSSLLRINLFLDNRRINSYWADGLIISTPTGSTAYSMAAGGPIVAPDSDSIVITPISPHSLTVRPLVIGNKSTLRIEVESRSDKYMVAVDSKSESIKADEPLTINHMPYSLKVVKQQGYDYFSTLREKLMWGKDNRGAQ